VEIGADVLRLDENPCLHPPLRCSHESEPCEWTPVAPRHRNYQYDFAAGLNHDAVDLCNERVKEPIVNGAGGIDHNARAPEAPLALHARIEKLSVCAKRERAPAWRDQDVSVIGMSRNTQKAPEN